MKQKIVFEQPCVSQKDINDIPCYDGDSKNYWRKLKNVCHSVRLFQMPLTKTISSPDEVTFGSLRVKRKKNSAISLDREVARQRAHDDLNEAFSAIRRERELFYYIEKGDSKEVIEKILLNDPKRYIYEIGSPLRLVNKKNQAGLTPLYIAARNGFYEICQILLHHGADQNISVMVNSIDDYPLTVAARWKHLKVFDLLIANNPNQVVKNSCQGVLDKQMKQKYQKLL